MINQKTINIYHQKNSKLKAYRLRFFQMPKAKNQERLKSLPNLFQNLL